MRAGGRHLELAVRAARPEDRAALAARLAKGPVASLKLKDSVVPKVRDLALRCPTLRVLWLSCCQVVSLDGVEALLGLEELYCAFNSVASLDPLQSLSSLAVLDVEGNQLAAVDDFCPLVHCRQLSVLTAEGNPVARLRGYRAGVLRLLPRLESLDDRPCPRGGGGGGGGGAASGRGAGSPPAGEAEAEAEAEADAVQAEMLTVAEGIRAGCRKASGEGEDGVGGLAPAIPKRHSSSPPPLNRAPPIPGRATPPLPDVGAVCCGNPARTLRPRSGSGSRPPTGPP